MVKHGSLICLPPVISDGKVFYYLLLYFARASMDFISWFWRGFHQMQEMGFSQDTEIDRVERTT